MIKHVILLLFLYGIKDARSDQDERTSSNSEILKTGIKKNELGANGFSLNTEELLKNYRNPVLEYLVTKGSDRSNDPGPKSGIIREIRHSQSLLIPHVPGGGIPIPPGFLNQIPKFEEQKKPDVTRNPESSPVENFWNYIKNKTETVGNKTRENIVTSPILHLNKNPNEPEGGEWTRIQVFPAMAVLINTFNKDGTLKNSVTHFQPDFNPIKGNTNGNEAQTYVSHVINPGRDFGNVQTSQYVVNNYPGKTFSPVFQNPYQYQQQSRQGVSTWPFADYFPIVIKDPYLNIYNAFASSMYNAVSSMAEYGPEADICRKQNKQETDFGGKDETQSSKKSNEEDVQDDIETLKPKKTNREDETQTKADRYQTEEKAVDEPNLFDEVTMRTSNLRKISEKLVEKSRKKENVGRNRRDTTSIYLKTREGDKVDVTIEEPVGADDVTPNTHDERARSFSSVLVNPPPLSTILRPPNQGYVDKKRRAKPSKPIREEGSSEEVGEEHEEESTGQGQESANEAVAISPPPEGASVAEAKPIGLAIAGPGGVAASKPQGTAVAGPGGLAIARPVGTAIAGVEVEGSVPIGGQQKNKKKPKQEQEQTEAELHYVGGLTGPIGNPKPKEFADGFYSKSMKGTEGNGVQDNLFFRGRQSTTGYQLKLGQQDGKYGFIPMFTSPVHGTDRLQKRMDSPTFFHGLLGNNAQGNDQFQNYQIRY